MAWRRFISTVCPPSKTPLILDQDDLPPALRDILSIRLYNKPLEKIPVNPWVPPAFEDVADYLFEARKQWKDRVHLGLFEDKDLIGTLDGMALPNVELYGYGTLESTDMKVEVYVLGTAGRDGTAVLLDEQGRVWLYNHDGETDRQMDIGCAAAILLDKGQIAKKGIPINLTHKLQKATFVMDRDDDLG
jgi:hypothetical protein